MRRPTELRLRHAFADILHAVVATTALTACGGSAADVNGGASSSSGGGSSSGSSSGYVQTEFTSLCGADANKTLLQGMNPSPAVDGAKQRYEQAFPILTSQYGQGGVVKTDDGNDAWSANDGEKVGALCSKASDPSACEAKVAGYRVLPPDRDACVAEYANGSGYGPTSLTCAASYILFTRGDEIGVARNKGEIAGLLGTVDTLTEALYFATAASYEKSCNAGIDSKLPESQWRQTSDGGWDFQLITSQCGQNIYAVTIHVDASGNVSELSRTDTGQSQGCAIAGRRPDGLSLAMMRSTGGDMIGEHFAAMAALEAASVVAFRRLRRDLERLGAPRELLDRMRVAARDEIRHARATARLAKKFGVTPRKPEIAPHEERSALEIARENAREGCVRETFGALVAHLQKTRASDADVRDTMNAIADEETEHAALSWDIAAWLESTLTAEERNLLALERRAAFALLATELAADVDPRVCAATGVPSSREALEMLSRLEPHLIAA